MFLKPGILHFCKPTISTFLNLKFENFKSCLSNVKCSLADGQCSVPFRTLFALSCFCSPAGCSLYSINKFGFSPPAGDSWYYISVSIYPCDLWPMTQSGSESWAGQQHASCLHLTFAIQFQLRRSMPLVAFSVCQIYIFRTFFTMNNPNVS